MLTPNVYIAEQHLPDLFERFYQVDSTRTQQQGGLGLALVSAIMQLHGGEAQVNNTAQGVYLVYFSYSLLPQLHRI